MCLRLWLVQMTYCWKRLTVEKLCVFVCLFYSSLEQVRAAVGAKMTDGVLVRYFFILHLPTLEWEMLVVIYFFKIFSEQLY